MRKCRYWILFIGILVCTGIVGAEERIVINGAGTDRLVIRGYDVVAYFTTNSAVEGSERFEYRYGGALWRFASAENRALFVAEPERYVPQYGGFCAWAASRNYIAGVDPHAFDVVDGKLYLNFSKGIQKRWQRGRAGNIKSGDQNWPGLRTRLAENGS